MAYPTAITAEAMASAAVHDPQFAVPRRPRQRRGLVVRQRGDHLVIDGTPKRQLLRGGAATSLVPRLLASLDGVRDHPALAAELGVPTNAVFKALALLWTCGVIEDAPPADIDVTDVPGHRADYLSRVGDATGANAAWEYAARRLSDARIEVFGTGPLADAVHAELGRSMPTSAGVGTTPAAGTTLVVVAGESPASWPAALVAACWAAGTPVLRVALDGDRAHLGPYVDPAYTPCLACLTADEQPARSAPDDGTVELVAGLLVADVFAMVSRACPSPLPVQWRSVQLGTLAQQRRSGATRPGCPTCSVRTDVPVREAALAVRFEAAIGFPPHRFIDVKAHQAHYKPSNLALQRVEKRWPVAPVVPLPQPPWERLTRDADPPGRLDAEALGLLLAVTAGWRLVEADRVNRWTASGGNIGSVVAHVAVRDVPGLPSGVYGYVGSEHRLALLRHDHAGVPGAGAATIVYSGHFSRVAKKYGPFALRVVLLDAGCAFATLRASCAALNIACRPQQSWDDTMVADTLGMDPDLEPLTGLTDLGVTHELRD